MGTTTVGLDVEYIGDITIIMPLLELNKENEKKLKGLIKKLIEKKHIKFIINLSSIPRVTAYGVRVLLDCFRTVREKGGVFVLLNVDRAITDALMRTDSEDVFDIYDNKEDGFWGPLLAKAAGDLNAEIRQKAVARHVNSKEESVAFEALRTLEILKPESTKQIIIKTKIDRSADIERMFREKIKENKFDVLRLETVGPTVGARHARNGFCDPAPRRTRSDGTETTA